MLKAFHRNERGSINTDLLGLLIGGAMVLGLLFSAITWLNSSGSRDLVRINTTWSR